MSIDATRWAWTKQGLSPSEKLVLLAFADRAAEDMTCFPSNERLQKDTGLNRKTIISCITSFLQKGLIEDTGLRRGQTKQVRVFRLVGVDAREEVKESVPKMEQSQNRNSPKIGTVPKTDKNRGESVPFLDGKGPKNGIQNLSGNLPEKRTYQYIAHRPDAERDFDSFWAAYPKKKSKGQALKTWAKMTKEKTLPPLETLLGAIAAAKAGQDWQREGGKFVPHPSTWLNAMGWEDESVCNVGTSSIFAGAI